MRNPNTDESALYSENAVLDLLHVAGVEAGTAAEALQALILGVQALGSPECGTGALPLEVAHEQLASAGYDAAQILAALGRRGTNLEFHEAAHATVAVLLLDAPVNFVSVDAAEAAPENMEGMTVLNPPLPFVLKYAHRPPENLRAALEPTARRLAVVALAGGYGAAAFVTDRFPSFGTDLAQARRLCTFFAPRERRRRCGVRATAPPWSWRGHQRRPSRRSRRPSWKRRSSRARRSRPSWRPTPIAGSIPCATNSSLSSSTAEATR